MQCGEWVHACKHNRLSYPVTQTLSRTPRDSKASVPALQPTVCQPANLQPGGRCWYHRVTACAEGALLPVQAGKGSATLSMAYAAAKFAESCLAAIGGQSVVECAYVESHLTELPFFASRVRLGPSGVEVQQPTSAALLSTGVSP